MLLLWLASPVQAQLDADAIRRAAGERGLVVVAGTPERWCTPAAVAAATCTSGSPGPRVELRLEGDGLSQIEIVEPGAVGSLGLAFVWQASGQFGARFSDGTDTIDLTPELGFEDPRLAVGFTSRRLADLERGYEAWTSGLLARFLASPTSLRDAALEARAARRDNVAHALATTGTVRDRPARECYEERSTPEGHGWFDVCPLHRASDELAAAVLADLDARLDRERRRIRRDAAAMHALLLRVLGRS